jgi:hypothetical protein
MKAKDFYFFFLLLTIGLMPFLSCKKDKAGNSINIVSRLYSPPLQICTSAGNKYMLDLDQDGIADIEININFGRQVYQPNYEPPTIYIFYNVIIDTVLNQNIALPGSICKLNDIINSSGIYSYNDVNTLVMQYFYSIATFNSDTTFGNANVALSNTEYLGFEEGEGVKYKYGWFAVHLDSSFNLYLDGVAINNTVNSPIFAGQYK